MPTDDFRNIVTATGYIVGTYCGYVIRKLHDGSFYAIPPGANPTTIPLSSSSLKGCQNELRKLRSEQESKMGWHDR